MNILELRLKTHRLKDVRDFYAWTLEFPLLAETGGSVTLGAGNTRLVFEQAEDGTAPLYHFAFNIPEHQFAEAKMWLAGRASLLPIQDGDEIHWSAWNAHAVYFADPAGNISEFIARHNLQDDADQPFGGNSIRCVSEIGLAVDHVGETTAAFRRLLKIGMWDRGDGETFAAQGDERGLFIVVKRGRAWFPTTDKHADICPVTLTMQGITNGEYTVPGFPYHIKIMQQSQANGLE